MTANCDNYYSSVITEFREILEVDKELERLSLKQFNCALVKILENVKISAQDNLSYY
jgi:hypothetical protein